MPARGPVKLTEADWSLGSFQAGAVELEPRGAAQTIVGLLGDDGLPYRRGGVSYQSNAAYGTKLLALWSGQLTPGIRTFFGSTTAGWGTLAADDATPQTPYASSPPSRPVRPITLMSMVVVPLSTGELLFYGGSLKTASYTTGTISATTGSQSVTGTGTAWLANADSGMILHQVGGRYANPVLSVNSDTSLTLANPWAGPSGAGQAYTLAPAVARSSLGFDSGYVVAAISNRIAFADQDAPNVLRTTEIGDPTLLSGDSHAFPHPIVGLGVLRDTLLVFTSGGAWAVSNLALDLTDAAGNVQQRRELVNADLIAWGHEGIASWRGALTVPALDGVWLMDGLSAPTKISDRIADLYLGYVRASSYRTGLAEVYAGHLLLPVLDTNTWVDTLVCRLQPTHQGSAFSWSQLAGFGAQTTTFAERSSNPPRLLATGAASPVRILNATGYFQPAAAIKNDANATTHTFQLVTRDIPTADNGVRNAVRYVKAFYSLVDAASDNPTITGECSADGGAWTAMTLGGGTPVAGEGDGTTPIYFVPPPAVAAARLMRFRFTCTAPAASLQFKRLELFVRESGRY